MLQNPPKPWRYFVSGRVVHNVVRTFRYASMDRKPRTFAFASSLANSRSYNSLTCAASRPVSRASASMMELSCADAGPSRSPICRNNSSSWFDCYPTIPNPGG